MTNRARRHLEELMQFGGEKTLLRCCYNDQDVQDCLRDGLITWRKSSNSYSVETITKAGRKALS